MKDRPDKAESAEHARDSFRLLPASVRQALLKHADSLDGRGGDVLIRQGDAVEGVFLVTSGVLRVFALHADGREATLYRVRPRQICLLSLNSTFARTRYPAWVSVESAHAAVSVLPGELFRGLFPIEPSVQQLVMQALTTTIGELLIRLDEAMLLPLRDRIVRYLARHADAAGCVRTTHQAMATYLGSSREVVSRELGMLKRRGRVETARGVIRVRKRD